MLYYGRMTELDNRETTKIDFIKLLKSKEFRDKGFDVIESPDAPELYFPAIFDGFGDLEEHHRRFIKAAARMCREYALAPIITDTYGNEHGKRREWRFAMHEQYGKPWDTLYNTNKLRANCIGGVTGHLFTLVEMFRVFKIDTPKSRKIREIEAQMPNADIERYDELTPNEKIELAKKIDAICREFLRVVTGVEPA